MKLNTQENNEAALSLYTKNSFRISKRKLIIMSSHDQPDLRIPTHLNPLLPNLRRIHCSVASNIKRNWVDTVDPSAFSDYQDCTFWIEWLNGITNSYPPCHLHSAEVIWPRRARSHGLITSQWVIGPHNLFKIAPGFCKSIIFYSQAR